MTVVQLIAKLREFPPDTPVWMGDDGSGHEYEAKYVESGHLVGINGEWQMGWHKNLADYPNLGELQFKPAVIL